MNRPLFPLTPTLTSSQNDFDFFVGDWKIKNRKLKSRLSGCVEWEEFEARQENVKILLGLGNMDVFKADLDGHPFEGLTLRLFNPTTKLWSLYWADSRSGKIDPPLVGSFEKDIGRFFCPDVFNGKNILVQFNWDKSDPRKPIWSQAFSADDGQTWEWNWYMYFERSS